MSRKFHIKTFKGQDDFKSIEEVIFRRLKRLTNISEQDQSFRKSPDLILIDGGKGQLSKAKSVIDHFQLEIDVLGLAKKEEEIYLPSSKKPVLLNKNSEALYVLQNIRDEAHRIAINENRRLRLKDLDINNLLSIKGVSEESINQLIVKYKTLDGISSASINDLENQITKREAEKVFNYFSS